MTGYNRDRSAVSRCKSLDCQAPIVWRKDASTGNWQCLNATPVADDDRLVSKRSYHYIILGSELCRACTAEEWGVTLVPESDAKGKDVPGSFVAMSSRDLAPVYLSHWRTCRDAERWRNRGSHTKKRSS